MWESKDDLAHRLADFYPAITDDYALLQQALVTFGLFIYTVTIKSLRRFLTSKPNSRACGMCRLMDAKESE